jgi:hypothetical protein
MKALMTPKGSINCKAKFLAHGGFQDAHCKVNIMEGSLGSDFLFYFILEPPARRGNPGLRHYTCHRRLMLDGGSTYLEEAAH